MKITGFYGNYKKLNTKQETFKGRKVQTNSNRPFIVYDPVDEFKQGYEYKRPVTLKKALYDIINESELDGGIIGHKETVQRFIKDLEVNPKLLGKKVIRLAGYGSMAAAFETPDGKIIKLTDGNHFPQNRPHEIFDVPIFKKGKFGKTHYYIEEKTYQHNLPVYLVEVIKDMIKQRGYKTFDIGNNDTFQIGMAKNGRVYLLDPECAEYKTIFHALFERAKSLIRKRKL